MRRVTDREHEHALERENAASKLIILWRCTQNGLHMRFVRDKQGWFRFQIRNKDKQEWSNLDRVPPRHIGDIEEALAATVFAKPAAQRK